MAAENQRQLAEEAKKQREKAEMLSKMASSREVAASVAQHLLTNPKRAVELAVKAFDEAATRQAEGALTQAVLARVPRRAFQETRSDEIVRITPDGAIVGSRSESKVRLHNMTSDGPPTVIESHGGTTRIMVSPDCNYLVIPDSEISVRIWNTTTGTAVAGPLGFEGQLERTVCGAQGEIFGVLTRDSSQSGSKLRLWNTRKWQQLPSVESRLRSVPVFSSDAKYFIALGADQRV